MSSDQREGLVQAKIKEVSNIKTSAGSKENIDKRVFLGGKRGFRSKRLCVCEVAEITIIQWVFGNPVCHLWSLRCPEVNPFTIKQLGLMQSLRHKR